MMVLGFSAATAQVKEELEPVPSTPQITERQHPSNWDNLVYGGRFMDRFLPMPQLEGAPASWGTKGVMDRDTNNGIEDSKWSYWGGNVRLLKDGKYHLFVCRWPENSPKGHWAWPSSVVVHAVADNPTGPYNVVSEVGKGHNPEWYITANGKFVIYVIDGYYISDNVNGPWEHKMFDFNNRDRKIIDGLSNLTFAKREDGSFVMVCRGGGVWISKDGISTWNQVTDATVYPTPEHNRFEDPTIWKTEVQYHMVVNDYIGRVAWHMRSKDGVHWKADPGEAYTIDIAEHADGTKEKWFKFERFKVLQDNYGRATQADFAVIDTLKHFDLPNDNHNSKHIAIPLKVAKRILIVNKKPITDKTDEIIVKIKGEEGFDPNTAMDLKSLRLGAPEEVNYGKGSKAKNIKREGKDALIVFEGAGNGINDENFAAKLIGKDKQGNLIFGYSRLPGVKYIEPILSARKPVVTSSGLKIEVEVQNFGQVSSKKSTLQILLQKEGQSVVLGTASIPPLRPYEKKVLSMKTQSDISKVDKPHFIVLINRGKKDVVKNSWL